jgi:hypothetical protein
MARLSKVDLAQMGAAYFESLEQERLVEVAKNLYELAVEQLEKLELSSQNSSRPPSSDTPYKSASSQVGEGTKPELLEQKSHSESETGIKEPKEPENPSPEVGKGFGNRKAGRQPGSKGHWREQPLCAEQTISHHPQSCRACNANLSQTNWDQKPYMGDYQLELEKQANGFKIVCQMHHYYGATCSCGHHSLMAPGIGEQSLIEGRTIQLQLKEQVLVGPMLAVLIASLAVRYRLSRTKIQEFLQDWYEHRQRCLAHLIRKALALSEVVDAEARQFATWLLEEMRELIHQLAQAGSDSPDDPGIIRFKQVALLGTASEHPKLKALAREILWDWDAVVAFVTHPQLPVTNNLAERALRHAVIARNIGFGTRTSEGSTSYAALLSVIETCRLRLLDPWTFLANVISLRRKGLDAPLLSSPLPPVV